MAPWADVRELSRLGPERLLLPVPLSESLSEEIEKVISPCSLIGVMLPADPDPDPDPTTTDDYASSDTNDFGGDDGGSDDSSYV